MIRALKPVEMEVLTQLTKSLVPEILCSCVESHYADQSPLYNMKTTQNCGNENYHGDFSAANVVTSRSQLNSFESYPE